MRKLVVLIGVSLGALAACGGNKSKAKDDAAVVRDDNHVIDVPSLPACANPVSGTKVTARQIGRVVGGAILATSPPGDPRLFVIEQRGAIRIFDNNTLLPDPFLDVSNDIVAGGEQGLLGLAFHPNYLANGLFFIFYTTSNANVLARCSVSNNPNIANPTCTVVLSIPDFASNHNGGMIEFGKDGYLYIGTGDGGQGGDPHRNGQSVSDGQLTPQSVALLGKILRIDVDNKTTGKEYGIPSDNPFAGGGGAPEIFMLGLRNPWRWSFDTQTGDMWIGDVGQGVTEELDVLRPAQQKGANLGWSQYEGDACCTAQGDRCTQSQPQQTCVMAGKFFPQDKRAHSAPSGWNAIIGGQVYRGTCYPDLVGWYFYTDNGKGGLVKARLKSDDTLEIVDLTGSFPTSPSSIHADSRGELYETNTAGFVYHLEASP